MSLQNNTFQIWKPDFIHSWFANLLGVAKNLSKLSQSERETLIRSYVETHLKRIQDGSPTDRERLKEAVKSLGRYQLSFLSSPQASVQNLERIVARQGHPDHPLASNEDVDLSGQVSSALGDYNLHTTLAALAPTDRLADALWGIVNFSATPPAMPTQVLYDHLATSLVNTRHLKLSKSVEAVVSSLQHLMADPRFASEDGPVTISTYFDENNFFSRMENFEFFVGMSLCLKEFPAIVRAQMPSVKDWLAIAEECFFCTRLENKIVIVEKPSRFKLDAQNRLHSDKGPAVAWRDGYKIWAIHGVIVPGFVVDFPQTLTCDMALTEPNTEIRRIMIDKIGLQKFSEQGLAKLIDQDKRGKLWRMQAGRAGRERITMVELINSTPEIDGTHKHYFLRVPPNTKTATEAVAWSFNVAAKEYKPGLET